MFLNEGRNIFNSLKGFQLLFEQSLNLKQKFLSLYLKKKNEKILYFD